MKVCVHYSNGNFIHIAIERAESMQIMLADAWQKANDDDILETVAVNTNTVVSSAAVGDIFTFDPDTASNSYICLPNGWRKLSKELNIAIRRMSRECVIELANIIEPDKNLSHNELHDVLTNQ